MENILSGLLNGNPEVNLDDLNEDELDNLVEGLGRYRGKKGYRRARRCIQTSRRKRIRKGRTPHETKVSSALAKFQNRLSWIENPDIGKGLKSGKLVAGDFEIYAIKKATSKHIEMFMPGDTASDGVTNINNSMIHPGSVMLIESVSVLSGVQGTPTGNNVEDGKTVDFGQIATAVANGKYVFENGQKILQKKASNQLFNHGEMPYNRKGEYTLSTPVMIQDQQPIKFDIDLSANAVAETYIMVRFRGVVTQRY